VLRGRNIYVRIRVYSRKFVHRVVRAKFILREKQYIIHINMISYNTFELFYIQTFEILSAIISFF